MKSCLLKIDVDVREQDEI